MIRRLLDNVMRTRAQALLQLVDDWLPQEGRVLDLGSGTGHVAALLVASGADVVAADVTDIHVAGPEPIPAGADVLPFDDMSFSATLMMFMLAYPADPVASLTEAARVTRGHILLVQTVSAGWLGRTWHRARELFWTVLAFHASRAVGYIPAGARFSMNTRRYYSQDSLARDVAAAGLRIENRRARPVLPGGALDVIAWRLEHDA
ncbi:MAG TPA: methyltransferase domain-containing protein [Longimicrobiales bacterium]